MATDSPLGMTVDAPRRRTVTTDRGVWRRRLLAHLALENGQTSFAQVAEAGVVIAPLGVVIVRYHTDLRAQERRQIQARFPNRVRSDLVYLIHRYREPAEGEGGRAGKHHASAVLELVGEKVGDVGLGPLAECIGRATRSGEDPLGLGYGGEGGFVVAHDTSLLRRVRNWTVFGFEGRAGRGEGSPSR